jgi:hypothetical protein
MGGWQVVISFSRRRSLLAHFLQGKGGWQLVVHTGNYCSHRKLLFAQEIVVYMGNYYFLARPGRLAGGCSHRKLLFT